MYKTLVSDIKASPSGLHMTTVAAYCWNYTDHMNTMRGKLQGFLMLKQVVCTAQALTNML